MSRNEWLRLGAFVAMVLLLCISSALYATEAYGVMYPVTGMADEMGNVTVDGSDFTPVLRGLVIGAESFIGFIVVIVYAVLVLFGSGFWFGVLRLAAFRRDSATTVQELVISRVILYCVTGISYIITLCITGWNFFGYALLLFCPISLLGAVIHLLTLRLKCPELNKKSL